jgi:hypothetical protein
MPARFIISRLSIIALAPNFFVEAGLHRTPTTCVYSIPETGIHPGINFEGRVLGEYALAQVSHRQHRSQFMLSERSNTRCDAIIPLDPGSHRSPPPIEAPWLCFIGRKIHAQLGRIAPRGREVASEIRAVIACDKREAFAQGSTCDEAIHPAA